MSKKKTKTPVLKLFGTQWTVTKLRLVLFVFSCLLYVNTIGHDYAQDDAIVIYDNMFVEQGISGIPSLLSKDTFFGFFKEEGKANLVSGGRYRPLTPIMFAIEWQIFGKNPMIGHLINVLLFGLLTVVLFNLLFLLLHKSEWKETALSISLLASLIFAAHPIHTEAVANIKGRDEIVALLASLYALFLIVKSFDEKKTKLLIAAGIIFFLGLMSKENTITFLAIIPLTLVVFRKESFIGALAKVWTAGIATLAFLLIRTSVLGFSFGGTPNELMNNPFLKLEGASYVPFSLAEKLATILFTLGKYLCLLFFPHPLTHDYYPRHVDIMSFGDVSVILAFVSHLILAIVCILYFKKNKLISYSILFYLITLSIVSNIVFPIGTNMSERFLFMPSVGFALGLSALLHKPSIKKWGIYVGVAAIFALSIKTILRNPVWKNDYTLFNTDVHVSKRSAKLQNAAGGSIITEYSSKPESAERTKKLTEAVAHLREAIKIHPTYKNAYLLLGNGQYYLKDYDNAILAYENALKVSPGYSEANKNLGITLRDAGRYYGEQKQDLNRAMTYLNRSYAINKSDYETVRLLGVASGMSGNVSLALKYFKEGVALEPNQAQAYVNLGTALQNSGDKAGADQNYQKALQLDPNALNHMRQ